MDQLYQYALNSKNEKLCLDILRVRITDNPYDPTFPWSRRRIRRDPKKNIL